MPGFLRKDLARLLISLNILALLASVFPWTLGKQADSLTPAPVGIHPEWYFMSPFEMLKILGNWLPGEAGEIAGLLLFTIGIVLWILIPFYDVKNDGGRRARIWFAIGLTHPEATSTLIHNFVFGWAIEWVFFMVELTTIAVYYYTWNRVDPKLHLTVGWIYSVASVCTLIIINGILTFMLTPGDTWIAVAGTGHEASKFWNAFFNPTYWPSLLLRTGVCTSLAGIWR